MLKILGSILLIEMIKGGQDNVIIGHNNYLIGNNNLVNGNNNLQMTMNSNVVGNNNRLVGSDLSIIGNDIQMFGENADEYFVMGRPMNSYTPTNSKKHTPQNIYTGILNNPNLFMSIFNSDFFKLGRESNDSK